MEIRTIFEITCALGFASYFLWSAGKIFSLGRGIAGRDALIKNLSGLNSELLEGLTAKDQLLTKLGRDIESWKREARQQIAVMVRRVADMRAQLNGTISSGD